MLKIRQAGAVLATLAVTVLSTACDEENTRTLVEVQTDTVTLVQTDTVTVGNQALEFNQIERLGRPITVEGLLDKGQHTLSNTTSPVNDSIFFFEPIVEFVVNKAGRPRELGEQIASILLPDMILFFPNRAASNAAPPLARENEKVGFLTWALFPGEGVGGRKLDNDDVVDKALGAVFGSVLSNVDVKPGLATDNVPESQTDLNEFPYVAPPLP